MEDRNVNKISFWEDKWLRDQSLKTKYPRLNGNSIQREVRIEDLG